MTSRAPFLHVCGLALILTVASRSRADSHVTLEVGNLLEYQIGRDPEAEADDRTRFFDQLIVDAYADGGLRFGLRLERFQDSPPPTLFGAPIEEYEYDRVAQRFVEWSDSRTTVRLGNGYAIFGHGLVLRAFELPGVIRQTRFPLVAYAESRDLDGVTAHTWRGPLELTIAHGAPVVAPDVAPDQATQARRSGSVSGASGMLTFAPGLRMGGSYLRADGLEPGDPVSNVEEVGAVQLEIDPSRWLRSILPPQLTITGDLEYAGRQWRPTEGGFATATGKPHALYTHVQIAWPTGALGIETKDYHQFRLAVNDPPSLVPEFSHPLLNRTTHVLDPQDERGHQLTLGQSLPAWLAGGSIEIIHARARGRNELLDGWGRARIYEQTFVGLDSDARRSVRVGPYFSDGRDGSEGLEEIRTVGLFASATLPRSLATEWDVSHQVRRRRGLDGTVRSEDLAIQATLSRATLGQVGLLWERTDDPLFLDDPFTDEVEDSRRHYLMGTVSWLIDEHHDLIVSYGRRRGGTACTSGTCYFVPDFEGLELRAQSRF